MPRSRFGRATVAAAATAASGLAVGAAAAGARSFSTADAPTSGPVNFTMVSRVYVPYGSGEGFGFGMGANEKAAFDSVEKYLYTISEAGYVNVIDYSDPSAPSIKANWAIDLAGKKLTDVAVCAELGMLFVAHGADDTTSDGAVRFYSTSRRASSTAPAFEKEVVVGPLPDMISLNGDCTMLAVCNEGEGVHGAGGLVDPEGSVSIVKDLGAATPAVMSVSLGSLGSDDELIAMGVHLPLPLNAMEYWDENSALADSLDFSAARAAYTTAMNLEPEYLAWSSAGDKVYVNLQENSAIVTVDVPANGDAPSASRIDALGLKDWSSAGSTEGLDLVKDGACTLKEFPGYKTMRMADSIALVSVDGADYILTANEGDDKEYGDFEEKQKAADVVSSSGDVEVADFLGFTISEGAKADYLAQNEMEADSKRRFTIGSASVNYSDPAAPVIHGMVGFGGRGISIFKPTSTGLELIWDSGSHLEAEQCSAYPWAHNGIQDEEFAPLNGELYNSSDADFKETLEAMNDPAEDGCEDRGDGTAGACPLGSMVDDRSPKDGAAPEAIVAGVACGRLMAVTATEKQGTAFVYDITNVASPELLFVRHLSPASRELSPGLAYAARTLGEIDPEGILFLEAGDSPSGNAAVIFGGAWSGTASMWEFECPAPVETTTPPAAVETTTTPAAVETTTAGLETASAAAPSAPLSGLRRAAAASIASVVIASAVSAF